MILFVFVPIETLNPVHSNANLAQIFQNFRLHDAAVTLGALFLSGRYVRVCNGAGVQLCGKKAAHEEKNYQQLWISEVLQKQRALIDSIHSTMNSGGVNCGKIPPNRDDFCLTNLTGKI